MKSDSGRFLLQLVECGTCVWDGDTDGFEVGLGRGVWMKGVIDCAFHCVSFVAVTFVLCADVVKLFVKELARGAVALRTEGIRMDRAAEVAGFGE